MGSVAQIPRANSANSANRGANGTNDTNGIGSCVLRLQAMPAPNFSGFSIWPRLVADAVWLHESGRAAEAMAAGWSVPELFGWSATTWQSLAFWLNGARSLVVGEAFDGPVHTRWACKRRHGERRFFIRNAGAELPDDVVLLWDIGTRRSR